MLSLTVGELPVDPVVWCDARLCERSSDVGTTS